jgi:hypothetical protein
MARETVAKRLSDYCVRPAYNRSGHPVYRVRDAAEAILLVQQKTTGAIKDPDLLSPKEQSDYWRGQNEKKKYFDDTGLLVGVEDARQQMSEIAKAGLNVLETLPDILERDFDLDSAIIVSVENKINELRTSWAEIIEQ